MLLPLVAKNPEKGKPHSSEQRVLGPNHITPASKEEEQKKMKGKCMFSNTFVSDCTDTQTNTHTHTTHELRTSLHTHETLSKSRKGYIIDVIHL